MTKYLYDFLCHKVTESASRELILVKEDYPMLYKDVLKWTYKGETMEYYEELRQQYIQQIKEEKEIKVKEEMRKEAVEQLRNVARWYAFQFLFEEAYRERFAREVAVNMLRDEKFDEKDIEQILPYVSKNKITVMQEMINSGVTDWEVITNG